MRNEPFKKYILAHYPSIAAGCRELSKRVNLYCEANRPPYAVTPEHIRHIVYGKAKPSIKLCYRLMQVAPGDLGYRELRPDIYEAVMSSEEHCGF